jgi:hypothetical protein
MQMNRKRLTISAYAGSKRMKSRSKEARNFCYEQKYHADYRSQFGSGKGAG